MKEWSQGLCLEFYFGFVYYFGGFTGRSRKIVLMIFIVHYCIFIILDCIFIVFYWLVVAEEQSDEDQDKSLIADRLKQDVVREWRRKKTQTYRYSIDWIMIWLLYRKYNKM